MDMTWAFALVDFYYDYGPLQKAALAATDLAFAILRDAGITPNDGLWSQPLAAAAALRLVSPKVYARTATDVEKEAFEALTYVRRAIRSMNARLYTSVGSLPEHYMAAHGPNEICNVLCLGWVLDVANFCQMYPAVCPFEAADFTNDNLNRLLLCAFQSGDAVHYLVPTLFVNKSIAFHPIVSKVDAAYNTLTAPLLNSKGKDVRGRIEAWLSVVHGQHPAAHLLDFDAAFKATPCQPVSTPSA